MTVMNLNEEQIIERISSRLNFISNEPAYKENQYKRAAVLVPLFFDRGIGKLLFIHRSENGELHRGEVAFPGGGVEPEDADIFQTALRETKEELGIEASEIQILGKFSQMLTVTGYEVTPVIARLNWPLHMSISSAEVKRTFSIPLNWLMVDTHWSEELFETANRQHIPAIVYQLYDNEKLWGFTAKVTQLFLELIKNEER